MPDDEIEKVWINRNDVIDTECFCLLQNSIQQFLFVSAKQTIVFKLDEAPSEILSHNVVHRRDMKPEVRDKAQIDKMKEEAKAEKRDRESQKKKKEVSPHFQSMSLKSHRQCLPRKHGVLFSSPPSSLSLLFNAQRELEKMKEEVAWSHSRPIKLLAKDDMGISGNTQFQSNQIEYLNSLHLNKPQVKYPSLQEAPDSPLEPDSVENSVQDNSPVPTISLDSPRAGDAETTSAVIPETQTNVNALQSGVNKPNEGFLQSPQLQLDDMANLQTQIQAGMPEQGIGYENSGQPVDNSPSLGSLTAILQNVEAADTADQPVPVEVNDNMGMAGNLFPVSTIPRGIDMRDSNQAPSLEAVIQQIPFCMDILNDPNHPGHEQVKTLLAEVQRQISNGGLSGDLIQFLNQSAPPGLDQQQSAPPMNTFISSQNNPPVPQNHFPSYFPPTQNIDVVQPSALGSSSVSHLPNPMGGAIGNQGHTGSLDIRSPMLKKPSEKICIYFNGPTGCRNGAMCPFLHTTDTSLTPGRPPRSKHGRNRGRRHGSHK